MERFAGAVLRLRFPILLIALGLTAWLGLQIPRIRFDSSSDGSVPEGDPEQAFFEETIDTFGNDQVSLVVVDAAGSGGVFTRPTLEKVERLTLGMDLIEGC